MEMIHEKNKLTKQDKKRGLHIPVTLSSELSYLCGVLIGDGSISYRKKKNEYVIKCVGNPADERSFYQSVLKPLIKRMFGISINCKLHDNNTTYGFIIYSKTLFEFLTKTIGLCSGKKDHSLKIPEQIYTAGDVRSCIRGLFDTDGSLALKKRYRDYPYYPVISLSSQSEMLIKQVSKFLKVHEFNVVETYQYKVKDKRNSRGYTLINRIELNGQKNLRRWVQKVNFSSPKHLKKIKKWEVNSGERI